MPATPVVQTITPIADTPLLFLPALAICAALGWHAGGRGTLAAMCAVLAVACVVILPSRSPTFAVLERGWALVLVAAFGLVCAASAPGTHFLARALTALAATVAMAGLLAAATPGAPARVARATRDEVRARPNDAVVWVREAERSPAWQSWRAAAGGESLGAAAETTESVLAAVPDQALAVYPALLGLESLAALALAWVVQRRISRTPLGEPLGALRDFRFNDQLVWGIIAGATLVLLPALNPWRVVGVNLLFFFGALYALRGLAVLVWVLEARRVAAPAVVALAIAGGLLSGPAVLGLGFLGLSDAWVDWRRRGGPARPRQPA